MSNIMMTITAIIIIIIIITITMITFRNMITIDSITITTKQYSYYHQYELY